MDMVRTRRQLRVLSHGNGDSRVLLLSLKALQCFLGSCLVCVGFCPIILKAGKLLLPLCSFLIEHLLLSLQCGQGCFVISKHLSVNNAAVSFSRWLASWAFWLLIRTRCHGLVVISCMLAGTHACLLTDTSIPIVKPVCLSSGAIHLQALQNSEHV